MPSTKRMDFGSGARLCPARCGISRSTSAGRAALGYFRAAGGEAAAAGLGDTAVLHFASGTGYFSCHQSSPA